jgi:hypothetical protein
MNCVNGPKQELEHSLRTLGDDSVRDHAMFDCMLCDGLAVECSSGAELPGRDGTTRARRSGFASDLNLKPDLEE